MRSRIRRMGSTSKALFYAIIVHVIVGVLLVLNVEWPSRVVSSPASEAPVQASVVSESEVQKQMEALKRKEEAEKQKQLEAQEKLEELLNRKKQEEERLAEIREQQEKEKQEAEELARKKEQEKQELAKLEREQELEKQRKEEERRKQEEAERKRKEEAERKRKAEEERKRKAAEEKRRKELAEKQQREAELRAQIERERLQRQVNSALAQYIPIIKQKVSRNWNRPASLRADIEAHVTVRLSQAGEVISARVVKSSGNPVFDRSVENAVLKASPLPIPQERGVNEEFRSLKLIFKPEEMIS